MKTDVNPSATVPSKDMTPPEIDQFLTCARVGRIGLILKEGPVIVPDGLRIRGRKDFFPHLRGRAENGCDAVEPGGVFRGG